MIEQTPTHGFENHQSDDSFELLLTHEPKILSLFVPDNATEQKRAFLETRSQKG